MQAFIIIGIVIGVLTTVLVAYRAFCYWMTPTPIAIDTTYIPKICQGGKDGSAKNLPIVVPLLRSDSNKNKAHEPLQRLNSVNTGVIHTPRHAFDQMYASTTSHAFDSLHDPLTGHAFDAAYRPTSNHGLKTGSSILQAGKDGFVMTHAFDRTLSMERDSLHHHSKHHAFDSPSGH